MTSRRSECAWVRVEFLAFDGQTPQADRCAGWECHLRGSPSEDAGAPPHSVAVGRGTSATARNAKGPADYRSGASVEREPPALQGAPDKDSVDGSIRLAFCDDPRRFTGWVDVETGEHAIVIGTVPPAGRDWKLLLVGCLRKRVGLVFFDPAEVGKESEPS